MNDKNKFLKFWVVATVIMVLVVTGWFGRSAYRHFKEKHSLRQAEAFLAQGDYRSSLLGARQTLQINPSNAPACRIMADLADLSHSPAVLDWRRRIVEIEPTIENKLLLASAGLRYQSPPFPLTQQILGELPDSATNLATFQAVVTELALRMNDIAGAQAHLEAATRLEPTNKLFQLNLSVLQLGSTNPDTSEVARSALEQFYSDTNLAPSALRALVADRINHNDLSGAQNYATQLLATVQATLGDRLQYLGVLQQRHSPALPEELKSVQQQSCTNALAAADVADWMIANGLPDAAGHWLTNLPASLQTQFPVQLAVVNYYVSASDWPALRSFTSKSNWGEMDFLRSAFLSHAWQQLGETLVADGEWHAAVGQAGERFSALTALLDLASRWKLEGQREDLLWQIVQKFPRERWAQQALERLYFAAGDTAKLNVFYSRLLSFSPEDTGLKNNLAATSLLLKTNLTQAFFLAKEAYGQKPDDPFVASTYAYSLYLQGRTREGVAAMEKMKSESLEQPSVALYYGVLLSASGDTNRAARFLAIAKHKGQLLPEEVFLLAVASR
jgi:tetratricopeptide (TPR) repeat protein